MKNPTARAMTIINTNGVGIPKKVPFPTRMNCSGSPETDSPLVIPIAIPLKSVMVARVARIGVTFSCATKIELTAPAKTPTIVPSTHAMMIHLLDRFSDSPILFVITHEATRAAAFEMETIERSIPPVSIESIRAILKIAISGI